MIFGAILNIVIPSLFMSGKDNCAYPDMFTCILPAGALLGFASTIITTINFLNLSLKRAIQMLALVIVVLISSLLVICIQSTGKGTNGYLHFLIHIHGFELIWISCIVFVIVFTFQTRLRSRPPLLDVKK